MADIRSTPEEDGWGEATLKTVLMGDFYKNPTLTGLGVRAVVTSIPVLDQLGDAQDIAAWVVQCRDEGFDSLEVKLGGLLLGIGLIPTIGSAGKAVLKSLDSHAGIKVVIKALENLNFLGQGNAFKWLKEFTDELPSHGKKAAELITTALTKLKALITELTPHVPASLLPKLNEWTTSVTELQAAVSKMFKEAAEHYKKKLDDALSRFDSRDYAIATSSKREAKIMQVSAPLGAAEDAARFRELLTRLPANYRSKVVTLPDGRWGLKPQSWIPGRALNATKDCGIAINNVDDVFYVAAHGKAGFTGFIDGAGGAIRPEQMADAMWRAGYRGGDIAILACESGSNPALVNALKRELSKFKLDKPVGTVAAPTSIARSGMETGKVDGDGFWKLFD